MRARITDATLKRRYCPDEDNEIWDDLLPGFGLRIGHRRRTYAGECETGEEDIR